MREVAMLALAVLVISGCSTKEEPPSTESESTVSQPSGEEQLYLYAAEELITQFTTALQGELVSAIDSAGAVNALRVCRETAPELAAAHTDAGWSLRRVTKKFRNPDNRADSSETAYLASFADTSQNAPTFLVDWTGDKDDSVRTFRYYQPIKMRPPCLKCHGDLQTLAPGVYRTLKKQYPTDRATGYRNGELAGMFVVEANWPRATAGAEQLLARDSLTNSGPDNP